MANIIFGAAASRSPLVRMPGSRWAEMGERDKSSQWLFDDEGNRLTYDEVLSKAAPSIASQSAVEKCEARSHAVERAMQQLREGLARANPDAVLVMGDDENEIFHDDATRPKLAVYRGASWTWGEEKTAYPVAVGFTDHVTEHLQSAGYSVHILDALQEGERTPHGFGQVYTDLMTTIKPIVPIMVNIHYPVNQTTPSWSYQLGQEVRKAIISWNGAQTVAVVGNGGLSTGVLREDFDRRFLEMLRKREFAALEALPHKWIQGPSGEIYNWIGAASVLEGLDMTLVDYVPGYRSPAGTGCGLAFATWS